MDKEVIGMGEWWLDHSEHWLTPGGDPVYICSVCKEGRHVYGIETPRQCDKCPNCGSRNIYTNIKWHGVVHHENKSSN